MQGFTQGGVIERQIAGQRVDGRGGARPDSGDGLLHVVHQGLYRTRITRIPQGQMQGNDEARRRLDQPGLRPNWAGQWLLPLQMGAMVGS